ncbi:uncharacterized protein MELLADRAFT_108373 [Melampsora larici-populina 98AG31]|uniref:Secreted protein n=1 Tax=Melampsora larici-populina (strain 98AG31 / pathotype 3-4-7) TaxID=747676 RepID=F4RSW5_MELLP|nr:uncharacterized protein MELLADRAFT_108373 [Melampsora larici-populina 98AG31]EGG04532.1 secreted protein [Melampsora larici-populina 98AG31]
MLSSHAAIFLGLCIFLPSLTSAGHSHPPQTADMFWRWQDKGDSDPSHHNIFTGKATATWTRTESCLKRDAYEDMHPFITGTPVTIKAVTINNSKDYMDPNSVYNWGHARHSTSIYCNAHSRTDFWIYRAGDRSQGMKIRFPDICTDKDCPGPDKEIPNVQCLNGPKGRLVMYRDKWINECIDP